MARTSRSGVVRPPWWWFVALDGGIVLLADLALNRRGYERAAELSGDALPSRRALQLLLGATVLIHGVEAVAAGRAARRRGLAPRGWQVQTFLVGFPSLLALRRARPAG